MRILIATLTLLFSFPAFAQEGGGISFGYSFDYSSINPQKLNNYREGQLWNSTTASGGKFDQLAGSSFNLGYHIGALVVGLEYNNSTQELENTNIVATPSYVQDSFDLSTIYLTYDYRAYQGEYFSLDVGAAIGYALTYEFHQHVVTPSQDTDITWAANPFGFKGRLGINIPILSVVSLRLGVQYEALQSYVEAQESYTYPGGSVTAGSKLSFSTQAPVLIDMSGLRYGLSLGFGF